MPKFSHPALIHSLRFEFLYPRIYNISLCLFLKRHYLDFSLGPQISQTDDLECKMIFYISSTQSQWLRITLRAKCKFLFRVYKEVLALTTSHLNYILLTSLFSLQFSLSDLTKTSM